jgi:hypothetical protein
MLTALDNVDVDRRCLIDAEHSVIVEIRLLHAAFLDGDLAPQRRGQAENQPALELRHDGVGIDGDAGIDRAGDASQMHATNIIDFGFDDSSNEAAERWLCGHTASDSRGQRRTPA